MPNRAATKPPPAASADETGFLAQLLPNRGKTRFVRAVFRIFLIGGAIGSFFVLWNMASELYARSTWPSAGGRIISADEGSGRFGSARSRTTLYWVNYEVEFAVPEGLCRTGYGRPDPQQPSQFLCIGKTRTRETGSTYTAFNWMMHDPLPRRSSVRVLYDPKGSPAVKLADLSPWLVYDWRSIFLMFVWMAFFVTFEVAATRRLRYLETLPPEYDATPPPPPSELKPWDLIDLNPPKT